ncbi:serine hydrolase domain-containing protein [Tsukamurella spumae]|uniref:Beta-lactamase family protein n=1 Tax=Tsukamurella spumae TaxID=44753 RepID=A0A846WW31_9ACTN|nr:serine hydrolase domain-containing protein [Tsukamurella spumae]NKY17223.1 beta-lactamase family protein [Tsukamurella spumae]
MLVSVRNDPIGRGAVLQELLEREVALGPLPGAVAALDDQAGLEVVVAGERAPGVAMTRDTVFRIASIGKPILAATALVHVERGTVGLDDPVSRWLPELAEPRVLRDPSGPLDDTVPAVRPITVGHLLSFTGGLGMISDFSAPLMGALFGELHQGPADPLGTPPPDEWLARAARIPLAHQPGEGWTYNTGADVLGVLLARATGGTLGEVLDDAVLVPLGMSDTAFRATDAMRPRLGDAVMTGPDGLAVVDPADGAFVPPPVFESGAGGLLSTLDDLLRFGRMLRGGGEFDGVRVLGTDSVAAMTAVQVPPQPGDVFLDGAAWGYGGAVDVDRAHPWSVPGRYGWVGGSGTALYFYPDTGRVAVWLGQLQLAGPSEFGAIGRFLTTAAG